MKILKIQLLLILELCIYSTSLCYDLFVICIHYTLSLHYSSFRPTSLNYLAAILEDKNARTATTHNNCSDGRTRNKLFKKLDKEHAKRYLQNISVIQNTDPYCLERVDMSKDVLLFPSVTYPDIVNRFSTQRNVLMRH